jgi:hypothetical protein
MGKGSRASWWEARLAQLVDRAVGAERLWAVVLEQGLREAKEPLARFGKGWRREWVLGQALEEVELPTWWRETSLTQWFKEEGDAVGQFVWVCKVLELPEGAIRRWAVG